MNNIIVNYQWPNLLGYNFHRWTETHVGGLKKAGFNAGLAIGEITVLKWQIVGVGAVFS